MRPEFRITDGKHAQFLRSVPRSFSPPYRQRRCAGRPKRCSHRCWTPTGTESLLRTLAALLDVGTAPSAAAARLGVHRSTVTARLDRLRTRGCDPEDPGRRLALHVACRVLLDLDKPRPSGIPSEPSTGRPLGPLRLSRRQAFWAQEAAEGAQCSAVCPPPGSSVASSWSPRRRPGSPPGPTVMAAQSCRRPRCPAVCFIESSARRRDPARQRPTIS